MENIKMKLVGILLLGFLGLSSGCNKPTRQESARPEVDALSRVESAPKTASISVVHKTFKVAEFTKFEFEVPAHSTTPKLEGTFETIEQASGTDAKLDFLIMTPEEYGTFKLGHGGTASYSVTDTHAQSVEYALPSTLDSPQKYCLVFRNRAGRARPISVKADLAASF